MQPFRYSLPVERIAQRPVYPYDSARLLRVGRVSRSLEDSFFHCLPAMVEPGDMFVFNNTAVLAARLQGYLGSERSKVEVLLLEKIAPSVWKCIGRPLKKLSMGAEVSFDAELSAVVCETALNSVFLQFKQNGAVCLDDSLIQARGCMPIPPYIRKGQSDTQDVKDYQTPFASHPGSVASPTASLHFTPTLVDALRARGCEIGYVTLHLGIASFRSIWPEGQDYDPNVKPSAEKLVYQPKLLEQIRSVRAAGKRVIAVGTSVVRALESLARADLDSNIRPGDLISTELFIQPGFEFKSLDAVVTNFHQPGTTHLLLVEALLGRELTEKSYSHALARPYRFLSYGDGMFIS